MNSMTVNLIWWELMENSKAFLELSWASIESDSDQPLSTKDHPIRNFDWLENSLKNHMASKYWQENWEHMATEIALASMR